MAWLSDAAELMYVRLAAAKKCPNTPLQFIHSGERMTGRRFACYQATSSGPFVLIQATKLCHLWRGYASTLHTHQPQSLMWKGSLQNSGKLWEATFLILRGDHMSLMCQRLKDPARRYTLCGSILHHQYGSPTRLFCSSSAAFPGKWSVRWLFTGNSHNCSYGRHS